MSTFSILVVESISNFRHTESGFTSKEDAQMACDKVLNSFSQQQMLTAGAFITTHTPGSIFDGSCSIHRCRALESRI